MKWLMNEESGQGMVEYGLILVLVSVVAIAALQAIGGKLGGEDGIFKKIEKGLTTQ